MQRIYLIESKDYYLDDRGIEYQMADGGCLPQVFTSQSRAIKVAQEKVDAYVNRYQYDVTIDNNHYPKTDKRIVFATRLERVHEKMRHEIRVYQDWTW